MLFLGLVGLCFGYVRNERFFKYFSSPALSPTHTSTHPILLNLHRLTVV
jgi:hypothetical protein